MTLHLTLLIVYTCAVVGLGIWTARFVRSSSDFFVANRSLGPGLIFSSMLAANIGAGATVGVTGLAYRDGISAWWWSGSAGIASFALAFWVGPRLWRLAKTHGFYTTGDFLEHRYSSPVRGIVAVLTCLGCLALLAAQLIAGAAILNVVTGIPRWAGAMVGGAIMTVYFTAGGLLGSAWVNTLQLVIMLCGFGLALPVAMGSVGGLDALSSAALPSWFGDFTYSSGPGSGWTLLALTGPAFVISPGLIQKSYGASSARALTSGIALNAVALMMFAFIPVTLGIVAAVALPGISDSNAVLPAVLARQLPPWLGALALAAVFSTEVDTCDAILFMISTSVSQDLYKRFVHPRATDQRLLAVARTAAVLGGAAGVLLSIGFESVVSALTVFYSLLGVSLFVPILGGLYCARAGTPEALASIVAGVMTLLVVRLGLGSSYPWLDPSLAGIVAAGVAFFSVMLWPFGTRN